MMLYGILWFQETPNIKDLSQRLFSLLRTTETSDEVDDICIKRIHALYGEIITASWEERYNTAIRIKQKETPSFSETYIFREVQKVFPDALQWYFIDGYELDIYIPSINRRKLNIEFDGDGYHGPQKKQRDSIRDRYLKEKRWIYVYRVSAAEWELQSTTRALIKSLKQYR